jgi:class 3 adenylate cyclase/pimeloyl-ACP methyl ester carboxylesterase
LYAVAPDGLHLAYQVIGEGPLDLVFISEWTTHVEAQWDYPPLAGVLDRLASFSRLVTFDKRGMGLSDPLPLDNVPTLERGVEDISVVMDAVGMDSAALFATAGAGPMALLFAATHPERTRALALLNSFARLAAAPDYPEGVSVADQQRYLALVENGWGTGVEVEFFAPGRAEDPVFLAWLGRYRRLASSPGMGARMQARFYETDVRQVLGMITSPTLVLHRSANRFVPVDVGRYMADHIPGARFGELPGDEHLYYVGDTDGWIDEVEEFFTGAPPGHDTDRMLATVLFTDIVASTSMAAGIGDARWREVLDAHDVMVRPQLTRFRGREIKTTGDGFLATFDGPARAIQAATAIRSGARALGIEVRAGLHTGEIQRRGADIGGIAVHLAQRVLDRAGAGQVLVSSTVKDLVAGSGIGFVDAGVQTLKGVPDEWHLFSVGG